MHYINMTRLHCSSNTAIIACIIIMIMWANIGSMLY